ncbi:MULTISPECIES: MSMEG_1061 family FMN-dependent PPOX-type flavoprotein [Pseudonocardia]|uniref:Pyridoxamine 5'-phosphate oxidase n=2 Tax=Pseudonocardia TaxID=1847 RepID=A0A1Y2MHY1_PSEAH|nr:MULTISPECIES: MSMEG_1061 family FMN-dependent PPOX-type flavoprotein [Pseudonocardia]OSY34762.1 Pyridoxamine 5'-phosphate oxidase [Pseudonocardia autotrophica]TDN76091.1 hypothetical protein C8E95_5281 [Pseudonocardia autotrophica]BBG00069.1 hypothetical protein Pdca_12780 [Pseudonocardia autotrophica]GEC26034.1 hypothetical protein PSA01_30630 [Pseudonocardia saturnea]
MTESDGATLDSAEELRKVYPMYQDLTVRKVLPYLDAHCRDFIAHSPFLCVASAGEDGAVAVSPRGDPAGFVTVEDEKTLIIPDRPGNNRLDIMENLLVRPQVGIIFFIPGRDDTLRVKGTALIDVSPQRIAAHAVASRTPRSVLRVAIDEVFIHCGRALKRSRLWSGEPAPAAEDVAPFGRILSEHSKVELSDELVEREDWKLY